MHCTFPLRRLAAAGSAFVMALALFAAPPEAAQAQGFGVYEQGTCTMGRAGTGVAKPCQDGSAIFYNPAGIAGTQGLAISGGATVIAVGGSFTDDQTREEFELQNDPIPVPHLYATYGFNERLGIGLGVFVPYGLGTIWPDDPSFEGRFLSYDTSLESIYVQPTVAYEVLQFDGAGGAEGFLRVGAGFNFVYSRVNLNQFADLATTSVPGTNIRFGQLGIPTGTAFADAGIEGSGTGYGYHIGAQLQLQPWLSFGVRYLSQVEVDYEGDASFSQVETGIVLAPGNPLSSALGLPANQPLPLDQILGATFQGANATLRDQGVSTSMTMPAQFVMGTAIDLTDDFTVLVDYQRVDWSVFDELVADFEVAPELRQAEGYEDTDGWRVGLDYHPGRFDVRLGYLVHEAAAPAATVTPLLPEGFRNEYTIGVGFQITPAFGIDVAYQYIDQSDVRGRVTDYIPDDFFEADPDRDVDDAINLFDPETDTDGLFTFDAHLFAATLKLTL